MMSFERVDTMKQLVYRLIGLSFAIATIGLSVANACDTPVYRYAMYRWEPAPYEIYYFHNDPIGDEAAKLHEQIEAAARSEDKPANVMFVPVPLKEDTELRRIPPDVKAAWLKQEEPTIPSYMVVTPLGVQLHSGDLDEATLKALLDSPARTDIANQLEKGKACVMVLLTGSDKAANQEAEKAAKTLIKDIADGKIELYMTPPMYGIPGEDQPEPPKVEIGFYKLDRNNAKEKWLIESLLSIESDLKDDEFKDKAMVFGIFGRGRALPPFVGKGINPDNLLDCVDFVTGACSCTVKDQNPGMDLLFTKDWWTAAENLANAFGSEEGNEPQYAAADFFPQLMIPAEDDEAEGDTEEPAQEESAEEAANEEEPAAETPMKDETAVKESVEEDDAEEESAEEESADEAASEEPMEEEAAEEEPAEEQSAEETPSEAEPTLEESMKDEAAEEESAEETSTEEEPAAEEQPSEAQDDEAVGTETIVAAEEEDAAEETPHNDGQGTHTTSPNSHTTSAVYTTERSMEPTAPMGIMAVGAGIAVALLLLFALTFVVLRPK